MHAPNVENHELWKPATCTPRGKGEHQHVINFNNLWNIWRRKFFRGESKSVDPLLFRVTQPWYVVPMQRLSHIHTLTHSGGHHVPVSVEALSALKLLKLNARYHTYLKPLKFLKYTFGMFRRKPVQCGLKLAGQLVGSAGHQPLPLPLVSCTPSQWSDLAEGYFGTSVVLAPNRYIESLACFFPWCVWPIVCVPN